MNDLMFTLIFTLYHARLTTLTSLCKSKQATKVDLYS